MQWIFPACQQAGYASCFKILVAGNNGFFIYIKICQNRLNTSALFLKPKELAIL